VPEGNDASIVTCSADNTVKTWKLNEESRELSEVATILQYEGAEEETNR
jgi:WD40 repeat protein